MRRTLEDGISVLAGAGIGVALMYLLDPEAGARRRRMLAERAEIGMNSARAAAGAAWDNISETIGEKFADGRDFAAEQLSDSAQGARESATGAADRLMSAGRNLMQSVRQRVGQKTDDVRRGARIALTGEREHHYVGQTACALGSMALGAGLIWAFDPRLGRSRRAWLRDKGVHWLRETGDFFRVTGRHLSGRMRGQIAETRGYFQSYQPVSDETLLARVRSSLGRTASNVAALQMTAQDGHVTVRGTCPPDEIDALRNAVLEIRGVRSVDVQPSQPAPTGI